MPRRGGEGEKHSRQRERHVQSDVVVNSGGESARTGKSLQGLIAAREIWSSCQKGAGQAL